MVTPYFQISRDAARALEDFSNEFKDALVLGDFETWAASNGLVRTVDGPIKTTFPIPISAAGYNEFKGDMKYRSLYHRSLSMKSKKWQDGVEEFADVIEAPDFIDWAGEPARMAVEWARQPNTLVMAMLESGSSANGPNLDFYRDSDTNVVTARQLFASDHPYNVLDSSVGSFGNIKTTTVADILSGKFFDDTEEYFRSIKGPNGKPLGLRLGGGNILPHPHRANLFKKALEKDTVIRAVSNAGALDSGSNVVAAVSDKNLWQNTIGYTVTDESTQQDVFYVVAAGKSGLFPWVVQQAGAPEEFVHDKNSERYKNTLKVAIAYVGDMNVAACLPHRIIKVTITG